MKRLVIYIILLCTSFGMKAQILKYDLDGDGKFSISDVTFLTDRLLGKPYTNGHEYVDLGLPSGTLWATMNIGASNPNECGSYFAWGETTIQADDAYTWSSYKWTDENYKLTKYCTDSSYGTVDNLTKLELEDDAAHANWGGDWIMPTHEQQLELMLNTTLTIYADRYIVELTSNTNGNSIIIPLKRSNSPSTTLWASDLKETKYPYNLYIYKQSYSKADWYTTVSSNRATGYPIRAVLRQSASSIKLSSTSIQLKVGQAMKLTATVLPSTTYDQSITWSSDNTSIATIDADGHITALSDGTCTIICTAIDGIGVSSSCTVNVITEEPAHEYVDLGLPSGTLWATCNVGANTPEGDGDYFAWGETTGYYNGKTSFEWDTYKWCDGSETTMNKYCTSSDYGSVDNTTELATKDDAAYVNWGSDWRTPSYDQLVELINSSYTSTESTTQNGVNGILITSLKNGNSIFLPCELNYGYNGSVRYWSRTLHSSYSNIARALTSNGTFLSSLSTRGSSRCFCATIRPVRNR